MLTLPETLAPSISNFSFISFLEYLFNVPVTTTVLPSKGLSIIFTSSKLGFTPKASNSFIVFIAFSSLKNSITPLATISPTSWTATNSSKVAFFKFSKDLKVLTKSFAVFTPTFGIPSA